MVDTAIVLAVIAGFLWAGNIVIVRWALDRSGAGPLAAATVGVGVAAVVATVIAVVSGQPLPASGDVWRFAVVGAIAPGSSQGLFVAAIGAIGPARTSVLVGTSPVFSVLLAIAVLDEGWQAAIVIGTIVTVTGGALISWEPGMAARRLGVALGLATAVTFAVRDVVARSFSGETVVSAWWSGALVLGSAFVVLAAMVMVRHRRRAAAAMAEALPEFLASGVMIGLALTTLLAALDRGRVGIVAPLSLAAQNVAVVALATIVFGARERTPRILIAIALVVAGATLVSTA